MDQNEEGEDVYSEPECVQSDADDQEKETRPEFGESNAANAFQNEKTVESGIEHPVVGNLERPAEHSDQSNEEKALKTERRRPSRNNSSDRAASGLLLQESDDLDPNRIQQIIKHLKIEIQNAQLEMASHQQLNKKLMQTAKDMNAGFDEVIAVAVGAENTFKKNHNNVKAGVVQKDIENIHKEIVIFQNQIQMERNKIAKNSLEAAAMLEKDLSHSQAELQALETSHSSLVKKVEAKERALQILRNQIESNTQLRLLEEIKRAQIVLTKREKRVHNDKELLEKNKKCFEKAEQIRDLYDHLITENYLDEQ